jgi:membrane protease YdiL (CAAX protease family)
MQGPLVRFLTGKHRNLWSILISNLAFGALHLQLSLQYGIIVFIIGCFWGWLYSRNPTLIGVCVSHIILGTWVGILGFL